MFSLLDFVYDNCLFKQFKVNDLLFIEYKCIADESLMKVWSEHNYFVYVISGKKIWQTMQSRYEMTEGQAIFVKKGAHVVHQFFDRSFCSLIIFVPDAFIKDALDESGVSLVRNHQSGVDTQDSVLRIHLDPVLKTYFQSVFAFFGNDEPPPAYLLELKFRELILDLFSSPDNPEMRQYFSWLQNHSGSCLRRVMESNYVYNMRLEEYARLCGMSLTAFKRAFATTYGAPPGKWLLNKRLDRARHMLLTTEQTVNEVASDCGFENASHFIRSFKEKYQDTPLQLKRKTLAVKPA